MAPDTAPHPSAASTALLPIGRVILTSPLAHAIRVVGDRWSFLLIRDAFLGRTRFDEFAHHTGAPRSTLIKRLTHLIESGVLGRRPYQQNPPRHDYVLTAMGEDLYDFALAVWHWEVTHAGAAAEGVPDRLIHRPCGHEFAPVPVCLDCDQDILPGAVQYAADPALLEATAPLTNLGSRRSRGTEAACPPGDRAMLAAGDIIGDHWTPFVVAALLYGVTRFDAFQRELGMASNILSDRLHLLMEAGVVRKTPYQDTPRRHEYRLTQKGRDLYSVVLALHRWADRWLVADPAAVSLHHGCATGPLRVATLCSHCRQPLRREDVAFKIAVPVRQPPPR